MHPLVRLNDFKRMGRGGQEVAKDRVRSDVEYEDNIKAELEVAHLHEKTDRIYSEMLEHFGRLEKTGSQRTSA